MQSKLPTEKVSKINHIEAGKMVRTAREKAGISLRRLAYDMDMSAPFLSDLERGRRNWTQKRFEQAKRLLAK